jgi:DNA-directed RNA polymerase specialized sigma24 family protein
METIRRVKREIRLLMEQIERDSVIAQGVTAIRYDVDRVQTSPVSDRMGDIVARITETTELLYDRISLLQGLEEDARRLLVNLKPEHERVLVYRYIDDMGWAQVSEKIGYNEKYIFTLRDSALNELDMLINNTISCASSD